MSRNEKFITNRIQNRKPIIRNYPQGTAVYYEGIDGDVQESTVVSGGETTMLANGDWCYSWELAAVSEFHASVRL